MLDLLRCEKCGESLDDNYIIRIIYSDDKLIKVFMKHIKCRGGNGEKGENL